VNANFGWPSSAAAMPSSKSETFSETGQVVTCPICLHDIHDWDALQQWRWDADLEEFVKLSELAPDLNQTQRARMMRGAYVRCPTPRTDVLGEHYLPANYGRFGPPVLLGLIGMTRSGKSHLLASMVGAIERGELQEYGITSRPIDHATHQKFLAERVDPLLNGDRVLPGTQEGIVTFADAFLMSYEGGPERAVALFDVAGGDLARAGDTKYFLEIVDGLFFVIDAENIHARRLGDETFNNAIDVVAGRNRLDQVCAAIVLTKADKVRFEEPVTRWLRSDSAVLDSVEFLLESADVYSYLDQKGALRLADPYRMCDKTTLHVASSTGGESEGDVYPRGVTPRRVLRPLVAMLAMTGVLTGPEAERVGI
jgi:hypothetical protein